MLDKFNDHQAAELLLLRAEVAYLRQTVELLKVDNKKLTESYYTVLKKLDTKS
jgi:hypothetical protein